MIDKTAAANATQLHHALREWYPLLDYCLEGALYHAELAQLNGVRQGDILDSLT